MTTELWNTKHPYEATEGNYFSNECHAKYGSWAEFMASEGDSDMDLNLVYRWDWREGEDYGFGDFNGDNYYRNGGLLIYFVGQRKALHRSAEISVCRADEPLVREWLTKRWKHMQRVWDGISTGVAAKGESK